MIKNKQKKTNKERTIKNKYFLCFTIFFLQKQKVHLFNLITLSLTLYHQHPTYKFKFTTYSENLYLI